MRILVISQYFWPESFCINDLAVGMQQRGHQVTVLTGIPNYPEGRFARGYHWFSSRDEYQGVRVVRVPLIPRGKSKSFRLAANYLSFAASSSLLGPLRCRDHYDAVFVFAPSPATVAIPATVLRCLRQTPVYLWIQDLWPDTLQAVGAIRSSWMLRNVERGMQWIYRRCDRVFVQSPAFVAKLTDRGVPAEKVEYLPNWADPRFYRQDAQQDWPESENLPPGFRIVYAGNIGVSQSFETVLAAAERCRQHSEIKWVLIGDGRYRDEVARQIVARGLEASVHMIDRCPPEQAARYLALSDAVLLSLRKADAFSATIPSKLQSYLASGRPILAAVDGQAASIIEASRSGRVGPPEDADCLARNAITIWQSSAATRDEMGRSGNRYCREHFDQSRLLSRLENIFAKTDERERCAA